MADLNPPPRPDLSAIGAARHAPAVPRPPSRWVSRLLLPSVLVVTTVALFAYVLRDALLPAIDVRVVPVVAVTAPAASRDPGPRAASEDRVIVQAPGWIEPAPYAIGVPALAEGVVREVLVLEGDRVDAGQVVARLVDDDARLALRRAEAELDERRSEVERAVATLAAEEARREEIAVEIEWLEPLLASGAATADRLALLRARLHSAERDIETERASVALAERAVKSAEVERDAAGLRLARMEIVAPVAGVVLARSIEPGMRVPSSSAMEHAVGEGRASGVMRLYDPAQLQARVDVPLADAARIAVGTAVLISTEALPDRVFRGCVVREGHVANIQRNTIEFKVSIEAPDRVLRPAMLVRARFLGDQETSAGDGRSLGDRDDGTPIEHLTLAIERRALHDELDVGSANEGSNDPAALGDRHGRAARHWIWIVDRSSPDGPVARRQPVELGGALGAALGADHVIVRRGVRPGDRAIVDSSAPLRDGVRVRVLGESEAP